MKIDAISPSNIKCDFNDTQSLSASAAVLVLLKQAFDESEIEILKIVHTTFIPDYAWAGGDFWHCHLENGAMFPFHKEPKVGDTVFFGKFSPDSQEYKDGLVSWAQYGSERFGIWHQGNWKRFEKLPPLDLPRGQVS